MGALLLAVPPPGAGASPPSPLYVAPGGNDASACSATTPCASFDRAYRLARAGQTVLVASGSYPPQTVGAKPSAGAPVVFRPAAKPAPRVQSLTVFGSGLEFDGISFDEWRTEAPATHVTFRNTTTGRFTIASASYVSVIGGSAGPFQDTSNNIAPSDLTTTKAPTNILIDGVHFHDFTKVTAGAHVDCIHSWGVDGLTIHNSRFDNCEHFDILLDGGAAAAGLPRNVTIENNFLDCCRTGYFSVYLGVPGTGESWSNILVRNNSSDKGMGIDPAATTTTNVRFLANIAPSFQGCGRSGVTSDYNVWYSGKKCGRHDRVAAAGFTDPAKHGFHLRAGAAAIDHGDPTSYPAKDIDGDSRPQGSAPDAGADERR